MVLHPQKGLVSPTHNYCQLFEVSGTSVLCLRRMRSRCPFLHLPTVGSCNVCTRDARPSIASSNPWRSTAASGKLARKAAVQVPGAGGTTNAGVRPTFLLEKGADSGAEIGFGSGAGMIVADHARPIDQHQRGSGTGAVVDEVRRAQRHQHVG